MHNIKALRENPDIFKKKLSQRNLSLDFNKLLDLDKKNRDIIQKKEKLEQEKKVFLSKKIKRSLKNLKKSQMKFYLLKNLRIK